jgi:uncharacterized protein
MNGVFGKIPDSERLMSVLNVLRTGKQPDDSKLLTSLIEDGYFVDDDCDERLLGEMIYNSAIYANTLDITILVSEQCNFRCVYCYEDFKRGNITEEVMDSFLLFVKNNIHKYSAVKINWFGGEPLLAAKEIEYISSRLIEVCKKNGKPYFAGMTTNGYYLTVDMLKRMLNQKVLNYQITLDGLAATHNKMRVLADGGPTFETIINNLRGIRDTITSRLFRIILRTNISKIQLPNIDNYVQFIHDEFRNDTRFQCYFRPAGDWGGSRVKSIKNELVSTFDELYDSLLHNIAKINVNAYIPLLKLNICNSANRNSFVLGSDGTVYKCTLFFNEDYNKIGRLGGRGKLEIDKYKLAKWISPMADASEKCHTCNIWSLCHNRNCPAKAFSKDKITREDCGYEKKSIDYILQFLEMSGSQSIKTYEATENKS